MNEEFDEPPVDLSALSIDAERRARRIAARVSSRIERARTDPDVFTGIQLVLARFAIPATLAAAASIAFALFTRTKSEDEVFAELVLSRGPVAAWVASGRAPDVAEVTAMMGDRP